LEEKLDVPRVGVIGYGYWGVYLVRNVIATPLLELAAIAEPDPGAQAHAEAEHPSVPVYDSPEEMLVCDDIDAVMLATPASTHGALGMQAIQKGCHLFVEKPLTLNREASARLVTEAERRGLVLMVGHTFLYSPAVIYLRRMIEAGEFGKLRYLHSQRLLGQPRLDCGVLWDLASHDVSIILHLLGERPVEVAGRGFSHLRNDNEDTCFANLLFPSRIDASIHVSWVNPTKVRLLNAVGTERMAIYDDVPIDSKVIVHDAGLDQADPTILDKSLIFAEVSRRTKAGESRVPNLPTTEPLLAEVEEFARACTTGEEPLTSGRFGLEVVTVLEALQTSIGKCGQPVTLDW
jgi:predicted dehydrogenase